MTRTHEIRPDLDEGIDRKVLAQLRARFMALNAGRMARALEGLTPRQQSVLTLLPLFFHVNHPLLPGYVSGSTPAGLSNFEPDAQALAERLGEVLAHVRCCAPGANATTKKLLLASAGQPSGALLDEAAEWFSEAVTGAEGIEGTMAFVQKRKPGWAS